ncbi:MAG: cyclic nucleotide-binding domain-containing protein [Rhodospirillales bacterium]|nr:cyclic nucleotide-binding domain-containing protein [Rhodospirillales bacterium]MBO6786531.1 cyclic nucleotide-binding domain-containing protein [Rhodospirillales bacterium]
MNLSGAFPKLTDEEHAWLVSSAETLTYGSGDAVISEGDVIESLLIIKSGFLRVTRVYLDEICAEFAGPLGPGEVIGEMSLMDRKGASANLIADGSAEILSIPKRILFEKLENDVSFAARFYESLFLDVTRKLRSTNQRVMPVPP